MNCFKKLLKISLAFKKVVLIKKKYNLHQNLPLSQKLPIGL